MEFLPRAPEIAVVGLVNGVAGYALAIVVAGIFAVGASEWHLAAIMFVFFVWFAWALVGTTRAGIAAIKDPAASRALRFSALSIRPSGARALRFRNRLRHHLALAARAERLISG